MADINTNNTATNANTTITNNDSTNRIKSKRELRQEKRNAQYEKKLEANRLSQIAKLEDKKTRLTTSLNETPDPKKKSSIQDKIDEVDKKLTNLKDPEKAEVRRPFGLVMKTWWKGLGKEGKRVAWHTKKGVLKDFVTIVLVSIFFVVIFFAIDMIILALQRI